MIYSPEKLYLVPIGSRARIIEISPDSGFYFERVFYEGRVGTTRGGGYRPEDLYITIKLDHIGKRRIGGTYSINCTIEVFADPDGNWRK